ncbi:hypothetical protein Z949_3435 [Sulfitobacter guttiformis KCTC 32187]|nr:hypothetical protein Z949_3435 [Sulfitobacter guttiformis KCTC 32187]
MSKRNRHQRRRRRSGRNYGWLLKVIVLLGQAIQYVVRFWFWFMGLE